MFFKHKETDPLPCMHRVDPRIATLQIDLLLRTAPYRFSAFPPPGEPTNVHQTDQEEEVYADGLTRVYDLETSSSLARLELMLPWLVRRSCVGTLLLQHLHNPESQAKSATRTTSSLAPCGNKHDNEQAVFKSRT
jgi:hypothetical protein